jgi:ribosomal protein S18 acetylase RimI-like enzyme
MTSVADEYALSDESYFDWTRIWADSVPGGDVSQIGNLLLAVTSAPQEWWNIAFVMRPLEAPERSLRAVAAAFDARKQPFIIRIREGLDPATEAAAEALGFEYTDTMPGMVFSPITAAPNAPDGLRIRQVSDEAERLDFARVTSEGFEMELEEVSRLMPAELMRHDRWESFVGYHGGQAACCSAVAITDGTAGITFVATLEPFRGRGFGEAMTWHAVQRGVERGCSAAALQASRMGYPIYERMGFRHITGYKTYVLPRYRS